MKNKEENEEEILKSDEILEPDENIELDKNMKKNENTSNIITQKYTRPPAFQKPNSF
jgi:hypothetical protein